MIKLTVRKVGNSLGVLLPAEAAQALRVEAGDELFLTETSDGYRLTSYDPQFAKKMDVARKGLRRYRNALRELSK